MEFKTGISVVLCSLTLFIAMFAAFPMTRANPETYGPRLDELYGRFIESPPAQKAMLYSGEVDIWFDIRDPVIAIGLEDDSFTVISSLVNETFQFYYIAFNMRDQLDPSGGGNPWRTESAPGEYYTYSGTPYENYVPLDDQAFRHALAHLIPKEEIVATVYGGIFASAINSTVPEAQEEWHKPGVDGHPYNVTEAVSILVNSGYVWDPDAPNPAPKHSPSDPDGNWIDPVTGEAMNHITFAGVTQALSPDSWARDDMCAREFRAIGLPIEHVEVDYGYLTDTMMDYHQFDMYAAEWRVGRFPDHLYGFFHSSQDIIEGYNIPGICDAELDALLETVQFSENSAIVQQACFDTQDMIAEKLPYIVTITRPAVSASVKAGDAAGSTDTLEGIVNSPGYGQGNDWTFYELHWASLETPGNPYGVGGTARMIVGSEPTNYHPGHASTVDEWRIISRLFDGLINVNPYIHEDIPWLATNWAIEDWTDPFTGTGVNTTFWLRDDVYFHDGVKFNATMAAWSLEFARDQEMSRALPMYQNLTSIDVHDEYTFSVYYNATSPWIFYYLAGPDIWQVNDAACWATMFPKHIYEGTDEFFRPEETVNPINPSLTCLIGTGPFVYREGLLELGGYAHLTAYRPGPSPVSTHWFMSVEEENSQLTEMFHRIGDVNSDSFIDIYDLSTICLAYGHFEGEPQYDPDADLNEDGEINIYDILENGGLVTHWGEQRTYPSGGGGGSSSMEAGGGSSSMEAGGGSSSMEAGGGSSSMEAGGGSEPTMYVDPPETADYDLLHENDTFSIDIDIANVTDLMGYDFKLAFNSTILDVTSVTPGDFFGANPQIWHNNTNNPGGFVRLAMTPKLGKKSGVSGSGKLATINFTVQEYGNSSLKQKGHTKISDSKGIKVTHQTLDGYFDNRNPGDVNEDKVVDVIDLAIAGQAYGSVIGEPRYNPKADITKDGLIDMRDIALISRSYGWNWETGP